MRLKIGLAATVLLALALSADGQQMLECGQSKDINVQVVRHCWGVFRDNTARCAEARAFNAATEAFVDEIPGCPNNCPLAFVTFNPPRRRGGALCERKWWSLWIAVKCSATNWGTARAVCARPQ